MTSLRGIASRPPYSRSRISTVIPPRGRGGDRWRRANLDSRTDDRHARGSPGQSSSDTGVVGSSWNTIGPKAGFGRKRAAKPSPHDPRYPIWLDATEARPWGEVFVSTYQEACPSIAPAPRSRRHGGPPVRPVRGIRPVDRTRSHSRTSHRKYARSGRHAYVIR